MKITNKITTSIGAFLIVVGTITLVFAMQPADATPATHSPKTSHTTRKTAGSATNSTSVNEQSTSTASAATTTGVTTPKPSTSAKSQGQSTQATTPTSTSTPTQTPTQTTQPPQAPATTPTFHVTLQTDKSYPYQFTLGGSTTYHYATPFVFTADPGYIFTNPGSLDCVIVTAPAQNHGLLCNAAQKEEGSGTLDLQYSDATVDGDYTINLITSFDGVTQTDTMQVTVSGLSAN
jgi:hypothetical protein